MIRGGSFVSAVARHFAVVILASGAGGCYDNGDHTIPYDDGGGTLACKDGVQTGSIDTGALLDLAPGDGAGATVEYVGDGAWRFAVTCDTLHSGQGCDWTLLVSSGETIESYTPEALELEDVIEFYPSMAGSTVEDAVLLTSTTGADIDAFTILTKPGAGMRVNARLGSACAGPYLFWTDQGTVRHSTTNPTDLFPSE